MEWISIEDERIPESPWHVVFVTDGKITCLANYINDPVKYYGESLEDEDGNKLDEEWHLPHWKFFTKLGPFLGNDECFGSMGDITHWMNLPLPTLTN